MNSSISFKDIKNTDSQNMFDVLKAFPRQIIDAVSIGENFQGFPFKPNSYHFVILGMGGSAIGGDILNSYLSNTNGTNHIIVDTVRNYNLPGYVDNTTNVIASSYSGDTEETNTAFQQALNKCINIICISSGGKIRDTAIKNDISVIQIPSGYQPRCALGYSFFPILLSIVKTEIISEEVRNHIRFEINETIELISKKADEYSLLDKNNKALKIAALIKGSIPVVYSSMDGMESVNTRWLRQIQENAKHLAYGGFLPEMNHNEINGFSLPLGFAKNITIIFIKDVDTYPRTLLRFDALQNLIEPNVKQIISLQSDASSLLARMFDMIYLGDWVSYYLAILNNIDPTPIPLITKLKNYLANND